jgi:HEAT repeat protein
VGTFAFSGNLAGQLDHVAEVGKVAGTWKWYVAKRSLYSSASDVSLSYGDPDDPRQLDLHVELALVNREHLDRAEREAALAQVNELGKLAVAANDPSAEDAEANLKAFVEAHPQSIWLPVANDLLARAAFDERVFADLDADQLVTALTRLITRWQQAALSGQVEPLQPIRATLRELTESNRTTLYDLLKADDPNVRAMAVFCAAFGNTANDLEQVTTMCKDASARVRAWAAYGLAERRDPSTDADLLAQLLADQDANVRQRACMAVEACISADSDQRQRFFDLLMKMVRTDPVDEVRPRAAAALAVLATKADLPALIAAEHEQDVPPARRVLEATIRQLGGEPKAWDED